MSELEKMHAVKDKSLVLSEFIDFLSESGYTICKWQDHKRHGPDPFDYTPEGYFPRRNSNEQLLADFFEIDLDKAEEEKQALLDNLRKEQGL